MDWSHLIAICIAVVPVGAVADDPPPAIISNWYEATADTTAVRATVRLVRYDNTFYIQQHATGTFGYLSPRHGFWRLNNDKTEHQKLRATSAGVPYEIRPFDNKHWRWRADRFREIDDKGRSFSEYKIDPNTKSYVRFFFADLFRTVDWATPFLPGRPNKAVAREWTYTVTDETDLHTWIRAIPKADTPLARSLASCDLYFQRDPVRLLATRSNSISGDTQTVILYSDVDLKPDTWTEPDLSEYKQVNSTVQQANAD